ncbi:hypothetical protein O3M35_011632 [Rhynocoris fuscipes]|uniref:Reverse transcriptase domain-containing protein n=1 Tax=Rhynocoris fuscipes TaxID=488301 RepID=A0AAW1CY98_9HEMI
MTDPTEIADYMNSYFADVCDRLSSEIKNSNIPGCVLLNNNYNTPSFSDSVINTLFLTPASYSEIFDIVNSFKNKKSSGIDNVPMFVIKEVILYILEPLAYIINLSLESGTVPLAFKTSKVIPVLKKNDPLNVKNYRPISLLPSFFKILEKVVYNRLYSFLDRNCCLTSTQFGFRKGKCTGDAICSLVNDVLKRIDNGEKITGLFCDMSSAFDCVNFDIMLKKLERFGVRGVALDWFSSYLTGRSQVTVISGVGNVNIFSEPRPIKNGVPQGSVLGPILFLLYINDLPSHIRNTKVYLYADDATVLIDSNEYFDVASTVTKLGTWAMENNLFLNYTLNMYKRTNFIESVLRLPRS